MSGGDYKILGDCPPKEQLSSDLILLSGMVESVVKFLVFFASVKERLIKWKQGNQAWCDIGYRVCYSF